MWFPAEQDAQGPGANWEQVVGCGVGGQGWGPKDGPQGQEGAGEVLTQRVGMEVGQESRVRAGGGLQMSSYQAGQGRLRAFVKISPGAKLEVLSLGT